MAKRKSTIELADISTQDNSHISSSKYINSEKLLDIDVDKIDNNPMQPRIHIDSEYLQDLTSSIELHGLIQPISLVRSGNDRYVLQAGQRWLLAHRELGIKTIKAIVRQDSLSILNDKKLFEIAVVENVQRDSLDSLEFALSLRHVMNKKLYKNLDELSSVIGKSKSYISKVMKVLNLHDDIIEDLSINRSTNDIEALYEIQKISNSDIQKKVYNDFVNKNIDRKALRLITQNKSSHAKQKSSYNLKVTKKKIGLEIELAKLSSEKKTKIEEEIRALLEKHLFF